MKHNIIIIVGGWVYGIKPSCFGVYALVSQT